MKISNITSELFGRNHSVARRTACLTAGALATVLGFSFMSVAQSVTDGMNGGRVAIERADHFPLPRTLNHLAFVRPIVEASADSDMSVKQAVSLKVASGIMEVSGVSLILVGFTFAGMGMSGIEMGPPAGGKTQNRLKSTMQAFRNLVRPGRRRGPDPRLCLTA